MPKKLRLYLYRHDLWFHFKVAVGLGLCLRLFSAYFVYGPQALDDYKHGVWPAYQYFASLPIELPSYRSHLLIWFLSVFIEIGSWFGVESALGQVRCMYVGLAVTSITGLLGTYLLARSQGSRVFGGLALYLMALFPAMPFISTRAFGEAVAISLVALALGALEYTRRLKPSLAALWCLGFLLLGVASLFRFHVGLIYLTYMAMVVWQTRSVMIFTMAAVAGVITTVLQGVIDLASGKDFLATLFIYIGENEGGGAKYGVNPWYNPWLFVIGLTLPPFSFVLIRHVKSLWREHKMLIVPFLVFVTAHSMAAHKEERFLYPIIGIELWCIAFAVASGSLRSIVRKFYWWPLVGLTMLLLPVTTLVNTQEGEIEPPALLQARYGELVYLDHESLFGRSRFKFYFLRPPSELEAISDQEVNSERIEKAFQDHAQRPAVAMLTSVEDIVPKLSALAGYKGQSFTCGELKTSGSIVDRWLYKMNPKHNQRRRPTWYVVCERVG